MGMIGFTHVGDFSKTTKILSRAKKIGFSVLEKYAKKGVEALASATPVESGLTASSWDYKINNAHGSISIDFINTNIQNGAPIAIILRYGHATGNGGWVKGRDYVDSAILPIFDEMVKELRREVTKL